MADDFDAAFAAAASRATKKEPDEFDSAFGKVMARQPQLTPAADAPAVVQAGSRLGNEISAIPRQLGLTARYAMEGPANALQIVHAPIKAMTDPLLRAVGAVNPNQPSRPLGDAVSAFADSLGLPKPETPTERVVGEGTKMGFGAMGGVGAARALTQQATNAVPAAVNGVRQFFADFGNAARTVPATLAQYPTQQVASAAGSGVAGQAVKEAGGGPWSQAGASLAGGFLAGSVPGLLDRSATAIANGVKGLFSSNAPQQLDHQISVLFERSGMDWNALSSQAKASLRSDLADALNTGREINPDALRRLADFRAVGATPTRGMLTLDPVQVTREQNLAKIGANSSDGSLGGLARVQNQNNATFISNLDNLGATQGDPFRAGQVGARSILAQDAAQEANVNRLYGNVRSMAGQDIPLDRKPFIDNIFGALQRENRMAFFPKELGDTLNQISSGQTPFTPQTVDMLKTMMATAGRSATDGNVRASIAIARNALENTPVNLPPFGGGLATGAQASMLRGATGQANDVLGAMNEARRAAAQRFAWQESSRPVDAVIGGAQPDKLFKTYVLNGNLADAQAFAQFAPQETRNAVLAHLKQAALSDATSEVGKFSQAAYNKALNALGDRKLGVLFAPEELQQLRALGRASSYAMAQPVGSAVNNSNSGALVVGKTLDALANVANSLPMVGPLISQPMTSGVRNLNIALQTNRAQNIVPGLLAPVERAPMGASLLFPAAAAGGLLAAP